ncbi:hypothetical protein M501DRAFT_995314 [Patellaria atrata CBS 101060]|uniref:Uncharacterized protein n=1 Tax=Patellaria atrata CBS 101060 TaxID=1346257 RepID=A0A9P4S7R6_9PEZI|nr:hypothetical protein M501DRAFT_995314 [Patellaria atrata CBS 101060]
MSSEPLITTLDTPFTLRAGPGTDLWRKPPSRDAFNAPSLLFPPRALCTFVSLTATFRPLAGYTNLYDQAGLLLSLTSPTIPSTYDPARWVKSGIELYQGTPFLGTVATDRWSDWSLAVPEGLAFAAPNQTQTQIVTVSGSGEGEECGTSGDGTITILAQRESDVNGKSLWVYQILKNGTGEEVKKPLREVCWFFADEDVGWNVEAGAYVARPAAEGNVAGEAELQVEFLEVKAEWRE